MTDTQINVGMNVDGVVTGTEKIKRSLRDVGSSARDAGKGTGAIGDGMAGSAQKVEAATKNMVGSIQRQIAALEAGDKSSRQYQESLARMRGIDTAALKPYLDQLDAVKAKQDAAAASVSQFASVGAAAGLAIAGMAAGFVAMAKGAIDAADNMNDLSQRVGIAVADLAKYELATSQSGTSMEAFAKGMKGLSVNLMEHGDALNKVGITAKDADGAMRQFADKFASMPDGVEKTTLAVKAFGKSGMDLIPTLNLGSAGLELAAQKAAKYAEQMAIMAPLADAYNDNLAELAMASKVAGMSIVNDMLPGMVSVTQAMAIAAQESGGLKAAWVALGGIGWELIFKPLQVIWKGINNTIDDANASLMRFFKQDAQSDMLLGRIAQRNKEILALTAENDRPAVDVKPSFDTAKWKAEYKALMDALGGGDNGAQKALDATNRELKEQAKLLSELAGLTGSFSEDWARLTAIYKSGKLSLEGLTKAQADLLAKQPAIKAAHAAEAKALSLTAKAIEEFTNLRDKEVSSQEAAILKIEEKALAMEDEVRMYGMSREAVESLSIARLQERADILAGLDNSAEQIALIEKEIAARKRLAIAKDAKSGLDAGEKAAKEAAAEWQKTADKINDSITDALMRGFESGKSFFDNFWDTIKNKIKTDVLRVMVQPVAQGITGMLGLSGAANAAGTAGAASGIGTLGSVAAGVSAFGGTLATGFMNTLVGSGMSGGLTAAGAMIANGAWASGLGMAAGALGPIGLGIAALSMIGNKDKSTANTGNASARYDASGNRTDYQTYYGGSSTGVDATLAAMQASYTSAAKSLGIALASTQFSYGGNTGKNGESANFALGGGAGSSKFYQGETASSDAAISLAASRAVFAALQGSDLPAYLSKVFDGLSASALSQDQITNTLAYAASLKQVRDALLETREPMAVLQSNVDKAFADMATSADTFKADFVAALDGGISPEKLAQWQSLQTSMTDLAALAKKDADAKDAAAKTIRDNLEKEAGIVKTWAEKLAVLEGTTTSRKLSLEADMLTTNNAATKALIERVYTLEDEKAAIEKITEANKGWKDQLDVLTGAETERSLALRDTTDASTKALMEQVYAQQDLKTAIDAAVTSQNSLVEKYKSPLNADTASQALGSDVVAMFAGKSADAIREMALNYAVSLDTQTEAGRAAITQLNELAPAIDYFATAADKAATASKAAAQALIDQRKTLTDQLFDLTATDAEKAKRARDAIDQSNLDVYDKVIAAQLAVKTATESATAAAAAFAKQMQRFGSGLDLRFDLAGSGGANAPKAVATYLRGIVDAAITSTANFQAGFASGMFDQSSLITQATANTESRTNAALQATTRLRGFFEGMANDAAGIEKAIADSGTAVGKGVQALNVSQYFTDFAAELTAAVGEISNAMQDSAGTLADSATILAGVTSGSTGFVQGILDNIAGEMTSINASDLTALVQSVGGGATQIGAAITQSILNSVSAGVKDNAAFAGLGGADLAYVSAVVSGVGQGDIQGINDAFLLLSGALTTGRIDATAYQEALNLVTTGFLTGADAATKIASAADILKQAGEFADRLAIANGTKTQLEIARKNELTTALDANNRATLLAIYAAEDLTAANTKAAEASKALQAQTLELNDRLSVANGSITSRQLSLQKELEGALNASNAATIRAIYAAEDLAAANTKAAEDARAAASNAMQGASDALSGLQRAVDAQKKLAQVQVDVASESVNNLKSIFESLKGNIATLYGEVDSTSKYTANSGNAFITQALATAKATGYLPDAKALGDAVSAAMAGASNTVYASQADADFAKLSLAGSLSSLKDISGTQLTAAEQTLKNAQDQLTVLDATYENAKLQLDAANNINTSVLSVADALRAFGVSLSAAQNAKVAQYIGTPTASVPTGSRSYIDAAAGTTQLAGNASTMATSELAKSVAASWALAKNDPAIEDNVRRFMRDLELTPGALGISLPGFAQGINYVPHDMLARIHEGEAVVPKAYNPAAGGSSNARLEVLVEGLTKEVQRLQSIVNDGNAHNRRTADAVNGNPEMPMLVEQVV